jgi:hypothetical protein
MSRLFLTASYFSQNASAAMLAISLIFLSRSPTLIFLSRSSLMAGFNYFLNDPKIAMTRQVKNAIKKIAMIICARSRSRGESGC